MQCAVRREHARLSEAFDAFAAQRVYLKRVRQLPEFGGTFFIAEVSATLTLTISMGAVFVSLAQQS